MAGTFIQGLAAVNTKHRQGARNALGNQYGLGQVGRMLDLVKLEAMAPWQAVRQTLLQAAALAYEQPGTELQAVQRTVSTLFAHIGYALGRLPPAKRNLEKAESVGVWHCHGSEAEFMVVSTEPSMPTIEHYFATLRGAEHFFEQSKKNVEENGGSCDLRIWAKMAY